MSGRVRNAGFGCCEALREVAVLIPSLDEKVIRTRSYGTFQTRGGVSRSAAVNRVATRAADQMTLCSSPTTRSAKKQATHQSSPGTLAGASPLPPSQPARRYDPPASALSKKVSALQPDFFLQRSSLKESQRSTRTERLSRCLFSRFGRKSPDNDLRDRTFSNEPP